MLDPLTHNDDCTMFNPPLITGEYQQLSVNTLPYGSATTTVALPTKRAATFSALPGGPGNMSLRRDCHAGRRPGAVCSISDRERATLSGLHPSA
jgi:hypothetical protein